jgi:hypothetical protein
MHDCSGARVQGDDDTAVQRRERDTPLGSVVALGGMLSTFVSHSTVSLGMASEREPSVSDRRA